MLSCWQSVPDDRPSVDKILKSLSNIAGQYCMQIFILLIMNLILFFFQKEKWNIWVFWKNNDLVEEICLNFNFCKEGSCWLVPKEMVIKCGL